MIKSTILTALLKQIQHEQSNAHSYHALSIYFGRVNLNGLASFMGKQVREERAHAQKLIRHVADRGGQVQLAGISAPRDNFTSPLDAAKWARDLERSTTDTIHALYELARKEADHALEVCLHWFIAEQVEEEKWSGELAALMDRFHDQPGSLFTLDHEWGKRARKD